MTDILPRGIRLNNPGNIDRDATSWQGMSTLQDDPRFIRFDDPRYGLRAMMKILQTYDEKYDLTSVRKIISRWAPPEENNTDAYITDVANHLNRDPDTHLDITDHDVLVGLAQAITHHENGLPPDGTPLYWYSDDIYQDAANLT